MNFKEYLKDNIVYLDGGMGSILQSKGLTPGELPERWNISHPDIIKNIHRDYYNAGSNVVNTNTFGANSLKFSDSELEEIVKAAVNNAKTAREESSGSHNKYIALDIGPTGKLLKPYGDLEFEAAVAIFAQIVKLGVKYGVDLITIETMNDSYETKAALLAAKENSSLPVIVTNAYGEDGKLMTGASPEAMVAMLEGMGADAIGANCSLGPKQLKRVVHQLLKYASVPVVLKPNAGLPYLDNGVTRYNVLPDEFSTDVTELISDGVRVAGGCCGTTPEYIKALTEKSCNIKPEPVTVKDYTIVSSFANAVVFGKEPVLIGERINPTGKKRFKQALLENDIDYILNEAVMQQEKNVHILDVNVGLPDINEPQLLKTVAAEIQSVINLPLQIDTSDISAMEAALRIYNGKALVNSVNGNESSMHSVFPLVKKYGGVVVALTLDENGIPETAQGRVAIAEKIIATAAQYGIDKKDIIFDTLAMTISADNAAAVATVEALKTIKEKLGCHTSLGISNISFGLPCRDAVNSTFFALCLANGLSAAIMNPYSADMMKVYYSYMALNGFDANCTAYINNIPAIAAEAVNNNSAVKSFDFETSESALKHSIIKGLKEQAGQETAKLLNNCGALDIIQNEIIPALNTVGKGYEDKTVYLPQLLMSAEAAKTAFEVIKTSMSSCGENIKTQEIIVLATVQGDIHDIGKNIVKLLLENYGFNVVDLGKDVAPEKVLAAVKQHNSRLVGLSALMTTTVPAMEETIKLLKEYSDKIKIVVGGAVLTKEYAEKISADRYAKDAMETVRYAEEILK